MRLFLGVIALVLLASGSATPQARFTFAIDHAEVVVPVTVVGRSGFVSGLAASDFTLRDNGRPQAISGFEAGDAPITVGLVVDHSTSMGHGMDRVAAAAEGFARAGNPDDEMFVVNFNDEARIELPPGVDFTRDPAQLRIAVLSQPTRGRTALYDAVLLALQHLSAGHSGRRALVLVSDGGDNASRHTLAEVREAALRAQAVIYTIGIVDEFEADSRPGVLRQLAAVTGGGSYFPATPDEAETVATEVARELRLQYTLLFVPPHDAPSGYRRIAVAVEERGRGSVTVRTRAGYYNQAAGTTHP